MNSFRLKTARFFHTFDSGVSPPKTFENNGIAPNIFSKSKIWPRHDAALFAAQEK
jgi:hypothetical protein